MRFARGDIDFSVLIDNADFDNFLIATKFCKENGISLYPSEAFWVPGCPDAAPRQVARMVQSATWDAIECVSWASAATNLEVLRNRRPGIPLLFTPHTQPIWTLSTPNRFYMVPPVFDLMLDESDLIFMDSSAELSDHSHRAEIAHRAAVIPLGVDTDRFPPPPAHRALPDKGDAELLCVGDFREHRKRPDLVLSAFKALSEVHPFARLTLVGKGSETCPVPADIARLVRRLGYVSHERLVELYHSCRALVLLSDFEAFGLPIAEALCTGLPVIINHQSHTADISGISPRNCWRPDSTGEISHTRQRNDLPSIALMGERKRDIWPC